MRAGRENGLLLPSGPGGNGQILVSNGAGVMVWSNLNAMTLDTVQTVTGQKTFSATQTNFGANGVNTVLNAVGGSLMLQQSGATYGTTRLWITNEAGQNGAIFEQAGSVDLVDFGFKTPTGQGNLRYERRTNDFRGVGNTTFEFQLGTAASPEFVIGNNNVSIRNGLGLKVGTNDVYHTGNLTINATGDVTGSGSPDSLALTLSNTGVVAGTYDRVTVDAKGRITAGGNFINRTSTLYAGHLESPNNSNWAINSLAPAFSDSLNQSITVRGFDDSVETGVGYYQTIPAGATQMGISFKVRPASSVTSTTSAWRLYSKRIPDNAAVGAWSSAYALNNLVFGASSTNYRYFSQTIPLSSLGLVAGSLYVFELTRAGNNAADTLVGDVLLVELTIMWS